MRSRMTAVPSLMFLTLVLGSAVGPVGCKGKAEGSQEAGEGAGAKPDDGPADAEVDVFTQLRLDERSFPLLIWAAHVVREDYFDKTRFGPKGQLATALEFIGLHTPEFFGEREGDELAITVRARSQRFSIADVKDLDAAADVLEQVLMFTAEGLSLTDEPLHELEYTAINGLFASLDPHTILLTPEESADLGVKTRGRFGGIGAEIAARDRRIMVMRVLPGSPAEAAGLQDNDVIVEIDEQSTVNLSSADAQTLLRGPIDSEVVLKVRRGDAMVTVKITRGLIAIPTVNAVMLPDRVGYVQITTFQEDTAEKLLEALKGFQESGELAGLVVDLRGNSGGLLAQAVGILNQVVQGGELVIVRSALGRESQEATEEIVIPMATPIVALVDERAASASEIVGGSLKHLDRGVILGRSSFGKGTVQELRKATPYGREVALKLTVAEYRIAGSRASVWSRTCSCSRSSSARSKGSRPCTTSSGSSGSASGPGPPTCPRRSTTRSSSARPSSSSANSRSATCSGRLTAGRPRRSATGPRASCKTRRSVWPRTSP